MTDTQKLSPVDGPTLLRWFTEPFALAQAGSARRSAFERSHIAIVPRESHDLPRVALRIRGAEYEPLAAWPAADQWLAGDDVVVQVSATDADRVAFIEWLGTLAAAAVPAARLTPCCRLAGGLHPLWLIGVARCLLPQQFSIAAGHDLLGMGLAQVALAFGADTVSGPVVPDRGLPLCGLPRPNEGTLAGLTAAVRHAGFTVAADEPCPTSWSQT